MLLLLEPGPSGVDWGGKELGVVSADGICLAKTLVATLMRFMLQCPRHVETVRLQCCMLTRVRSGGRLVQLSAIGDCSQR